MLQWYIYRNSEKYGPYDDDYFFQMGREGKILENDLVWNENFTQWVPAGNVNGLLPQNAYAPVPQDKPDTTKKKSHALPIAAAIIGAVFFVGLLAVGGIFLLTRSRTQEVGSVYVDMNGGEFVGEDISIKANPTSLGEPFEGYIHRFSEPFEKNEDEIYRGEGFLLKEEWQKMGGSIDVTFPMPETAFNSGYTRDEVKESLQVALGWVGTTRSGEKIWSENYYPVEVDFDAKTMTATIEFVEPGIPLEEDLRSPSPVQTPLSLSASLKSFFVLPFSSSALPPGVDGISQLHTDNNGIVLIPVQNDLSEPEGTYLSENEIFEFRYRRRRHSGLMEISIEGLLSELERQRSNIENLDFNFARRTSLPVEVRIARNLDGAAGRYVNGWWNNPQSGHLVFRHDDVLSIRGTKHTDVGEDLKATIGHELFHLVTDTYTPGSNHPRYTWIDEAAAVWFERFATGNNSYVTTVVNTGDTFYENPFFERQRSASHGYGSSFFFRYMSWRYSDRFPERIYSQIAAGESVKDSVFSAFSQDGISLSSYWKNFLESHLIYPARMGILEGDGDIMRTLPRFVVLDAQNEEDEVSLEFRSLQRLDSDGPYKPSIGGGWNLFPDELPEEGVDLKMEIKLDALSAYAFNIREISDLREKVGGEDINMSIAVTTPIMSAGVMIYCLDSSNSVRDVASADNFLAGNPEPIAIPTGASQIWVIIFNDDLQSDEPATIRFQARAVIETVERQVEGWSGTYEMDTFQFADLDCLIEEYKGYHGHEPGRGGNGCYPSPCDNVRCSYCYPDTWFTHPSDISFKLEVDEHGNYSFANESLRISGPVAMHAWQIGEVYEADISGNRIVFKTTHAHFEGTVDFSNKTASGTMTSYHGRYWPEATECDYCGVLGTGTWQAALD